MLTAVAGADVIRLNVGSGGQTFPGWISTDKKDLDISRRRDWERLLRGRRVDNVLAEHVIEHLEEQDIVKALQNVARFLKTGGTFRMAVPDGNHPSEYVRDMSKPGGWGEGADDHKVFLTVRDIPKLGQSSGLKPEPMEYFDDDGWFVSRPMQPQRGYIRRCAEQYPGSFRDSPTEMDKLLAAVPPHLRAQFKEKGIFNTSLIIDWVKP